MRTIAAVCSIAIVTLAVTACKSKKTPPPKTYQVRGVVQHVPDKGPPALVVRHEAIDHFVHSDGVAAGMDSMTMTLHLADGVSAKGIKPGDKIAFDLEVNWSRTPPLEIIKLSKLPADTELVFSKAKGTKRR